MVSYKAFVFFSVLLTLVQLDAVPLNNDFKGDDVNMDAMVDNAFDSIFRRARGCRNLSSATFCKRMRKYCGRSDKNGRFMKARCHWQCGCE